ncbi:MAG: SMP-30/gluconolactonase/LRE family protein [Lentisphaeraceae bacterium]|nr:SMP-30/gluconolactonase/LRE family protein [Lentisphaeraceae bacterium]
MIKYLISLTVLCLSLTGEVKTSPEPLADEIFAIGATWQQLSSEHAGCEGAQWIVEDGVPTLYYAAHHDLLAYKWTEKSGLKVWRNDSPEATSFRPDGKGGYFVVEQNTRRLVRWDKNGQVSEVLADRFKGKRLNRPNDCRLKSDQTIWFTDPAFLFNKRPEDKKELKGQFVFRYDLKTKKLDAVAKGFKNPNGIAFSPDEKFLYVGDSGTIYRWKISQSGELDNKTIFAKRLKGLDGLTFDKDGRLWACLIDSIRIITQDGKTVGDIQTPGKPTSIDFSEEAKKVCITCRDAAYIVNLKK